MGWGDKPLCGMRLGGWPDQSPAQEGASGQEGGMPSSHFEQQLVLGDPLDRLQQVRVEA